VNFLRKFDNFKGDSCLFIAAQQGNRQIMDLLASWGADFNQ